eukprot:5845308-Amphidinium_carterae.2
MQICARLEYANLCKTDVIVPFSAGAYDPHTRFRGQALDVFKTFSLSHASSERVSNDKGDANENASANSS